MPNSLLQKLYDFSNQTAVITGGTGILGREIVCVLAELGANVVVIGRSHDLPDAVRERTSGCAGRVYLHRADVLDRTALQEAEVEIHARFGTASLLINFAGGNRPAATTTNAQLFFDLPEEALRSVFDVNLLGTIFPCQVFGRGMAERKQGSILNISSMASYRPLSRVVAYSAAKAGVNNFTQWLATHMALEYSPAIRVNAIAPGFFLTEQNNYLMIDQASGDLTPRGKTILNHLPAARFGSPEDLVGAVLWLLSPASAYVTGVVIPIDGGFSAYTGV